MKQTRTQSFSLAAAIVAAAMSMTMLAASPAAAVQTPQDVLASANPVDWTPNILDGQVNAIIQIGSTVYVGGTFTQVRRANTSNTLTRNYLFAYDVNTGVISPTFIPQLDREVEGLEPGPDGSIFVVGGFNAVNGEAYRKIVRLNTANGSVVPGFKANADGLAQDVKVRDGWLYVSGKFFTVKGEARSGLVRLDPGTGAVDPAFNIPFTDPPRATMGVPHIDITPDGSKLVAMGNFSKVGGLPRVQLAILDLTPTPSVSTWQTNQTPVYESNGTTTWCSSSFGTWMRDIDISPDGSYFVLVTTGAKRTNRLCDTASRWELGTSGPGQEPTWVNWSGGDTFWGVAVTGPAIYVGGHFRWLNNPFGTDSAGGGNVPREGLAALDPINGLPLDWNPGRDRGVGTFDIVGTPSGVFVGSDTDVLGGEFHQKFGMFPLTGGTTIPPVKTYGLPNDLYAIAESSGAVTRRSYDLTTLGTTENVSIPGLTGSNVRGAFALGGKLYTGMNDGRVYVRDFDGTNAGAATQLPYNLIDTQPPSAYTIPGTNTRQPAWGTQIRTITGMFYDQGRIYYTVSGENRLYYRYFTPQSQIVGADLFVASTGDGVTWNNVRGMTMASGRLIYGTTGNQLLSIAWGGTKPTGSASTVSASGTWASRALFAFPQVTDSFPPSAPGKPSGTSPQVGRIDLNWAAATDNTSSALTYRVYRDDEATPIGQVQGGVTGTITYSDTGLAGGSSHTYRVDAVDGANNAGPLSPASDPIEVLAPDTTPPAQPSSPSAVSTRAATVDLSWPATTDDRSTTLTYRIYRDGGTTPIGQVQGGVTGTIDYVDTGLANGSTHTYRVDAVDADGNESQKSPVSNDVTVFTPSAERVVFADSFDDGTFGRWTSVTRLSIDPTRGSPSAPSARMATTNQNASASVDFAPVTTSCTSTRLNVQTKAAGVTLDVFRLRTATNGALIKVYLNGDNRPAIRNDYAGTQQLALPAAAVGAGWHTFRLCGTTGPGGSWTLSVDDVAVVSNFVTDTGPNAAARLQIGDTAAKTITANWDDVSVRVPADPGDPPPPTERVVFADSFDDGTFGRWTSVTRLSIDPTRGSPSAPSARMATTNQNASASVDFAPVTTSCTSTRLNVQTKAAGVTLDVFRLRTATNGALIKVYLNGDNRPAIRNDYAGTQQLALPAAAVGAGWHTFRLCGTTGPGGSWTLSVDDVAVVSNFVTDTGPNAAARLQIGDTAAKTITANWDDVSITAPL
jgi:hypothetical protein